MYLIKKVEFDSLENQISKAVCITNVGVIDGDENEAQKWIDQHQSDLGVKYKGWDGNHYPYYEKEYLENLPILNCNTTNTKYLTVIDVSDATQRILDFISSDELDKQFKSTTFSSDINYKNAMIHGMCLAGMALSTCVQHFVKVSTEDTVENERG